MKEDHPLHKKQLLKNYCTGGKNPKLRQNKTKQKYDTSLKILGFKRKRQSGLSCPAHGWLGAWIGTQSPDQLTTRLLW